MSRVCESFRYSYNPLENEVTSQITGKVHLHVRFERVRICRINEEYESTAKT